MKNKTQSFDINNIHLTIQSPHVAINEELSNYLILQIEKLGNIYTRIERCETMFLTRNNDQKDYCEVEVKLIVPGKVLFAKEQKANFRLAAQSVFEDLFNQLHKFKGQLTDKNLSKSHSEDELFNLV